jgi:succinate-semialdehyde dehydrogenase/glutarate-semialdehyde dehydrogenase
MSLKSINPTTDELVKEYPEHTPEEVADILAAAEAAFSAWRGAGPAHRGQILRRAGALLEERKDPLAHLMATEMGKPVAQGRAEVDKCAWVCRYYADHGARLLAPETVETEAAHSFVTFQPLGLVLAVMPWNFPFWQVFRFAAPALMAGNVGVLKHSSGVVGCALAIEELLQEAGVPEAAFRTLLLPSSRVDELIVAPEVKAVTLTGSTPAGRAVAARAGAMLKKTVLELGGSDAYVVLEDADLETAAEACAVSRMINAGQSCIAAKRFVVVEAVRERFEALFVERMRSFRVGDPLDPATEVGPLARRDLRDDLHRQVVGSVNKGARLLLGGEQPSGPGAFYPPTVLTGVTKGMPAHDEEMFGPVAAVISAADEDEALARANDSVFGLGAAVFTRDNVRGERIAAERLEAGSCFVNTFVRSDPRLPFGGIKESGFGRELSQFGIREFVNTKTVYVK